MTLQLKVFSSHEYSSAKDLEEALNNFSNAHRISSVSNLPRDLQIEGAVPRMVRGYDLVVQYEEINSHRTSRETTSAKDSHTLRYGQRGTLILGKKKTKLSMVEMEYMNRFLSSGDGVVTHEELSKIHNSSDDGSMARRITITRLRKKIKKLGYEIVSAGKLGYVLKHNT